jgi:hypothetical protein
MSEIGIAVVQHTKRRLLIGCLTILIGLPLMACCLFLIITVLLPTIDNLYTAGDQNISTIFIIGIGLIVIFGMLSVPLVAFLIITRRRTTILDAIFKPLGLQGQMYMLNGRHYWGNIAGREVDFYIYRGPTLEIRLSAHTQTRVQIMPRNSLPANIAGMLDKNPIQTQDPALAGYSIYPSDERWAQTLLAEPDAIKAIQDLMTQHNEWALFRHVEIQTGEVLLYLNRSRQLFVNLQQFNAIPFWLSALQTLANIAEAQPEPQIKTQPMIANSRQVRQKKNKILNYILLFILIGMPICLFLIGVLAYFLVSM